MRGTIGGLPGESLSPVDIVQLCSAFGTWVLDQGKGKTLVIGRDARKSGDMVSSIAVSTFVGLGIDVIDLGLSTTPTVEMAVIHKKAAGGVIITASHNPGNWNALKFLNHHGEFISPEAGKEVLGLAEKNRFKYAEVDQLGSFSFEAQHLDKHIESIKGLDLVDADKIKDHGFRVAVDGVNSSGGLAIPKLLLALGVTEIVQVNCEPSGEFAHNPEPLPENLQELSALVKESKCHLGISVDPDVDRLALIDENGNPFGEEYTLVAVADYVTSKTPGSVVSNMSSSRALKDLAESKGLAYSSSPVGEVHVVREMKSVNAVIGGEGNGGIIYPELHYGRDALVGVALLLSFLAEKGVSMSKLKEGYAPYVIVKEKLELEPEKDLNEMFEKIRNTYPDAKIDDRDGLKFDFNDSWAHLRRSNTEPIIRIYTEAENDDRALELAEMVKRDLLKLIN